METLALHTGAPTVHWEDKTIYISVFEVERITPRIKHIDIPVCFLQSIFDNGIFIQNIISIVSCWHICAPNHIQVQLAVGVLNG